MHLHSLPHCICCKHPPTLTALVVVVLLLLPAYIHAALSACSSRSAMCPAACPCLCPPQRICTCSTGARRAGSIQRCHGPWHAGSQTAATRRWTCLKPPPLHPAGRSLQTPLRGWPAQRSGLSSRAAPRSCRRQGAGRHPRTCSRSRRPAAAAVAGAAQTASCWQRSGSLSATCACAHRRRRQPAATGQLQLQEASAGAPGSAGVACLRRHARLQQWGRVRVVLCSAQ